MRIQRIQWAGIIIQSKNTVLMVDPIYKGFSENFFGRPHESFYPLSDFVKPNAIAVTHLHSDHFDPTSIFEAFGSDIPIYVLKENVLNASGKELTNIQGVSLGERMEIGDLTLTAVFASDGLGDPQVSWIIEGDGKKVIHCGDTLWHGHWWNIASKFGPFHAAFLPVNGAVVRDPDLTPSDINICLTPEQAAEAASILQAKAVVPIHYGAFHHPPNYVQTPDLEKRLETSLQKKGIEAFWLKNKESLTLR